jgi:O-antigen ligase
MSKNEPEAIPPHLESVVRQSWWVVIPCVWAVMMVTFSAPGRLESGGSVGTLDWIAMTKIVTRSVCMLALLWTLYRLWGHPKRERVALCMLPLGLYVLYAMLSALWSPLPKVSLGQAVSSLGIQMLVALLLGILWRDEKDTQRLLLTAVFAGVVTCTYTLYIFVYYPPGTSGLRGIILDEGDLRDPQGVHHATDLGAIGSLTIMLTIIPLVLWGWRWCKIWLLPVLASAGLVLILASNRMALGCTALILGLLFLFVLRKIVVVLIALAACAGLFGYMMVDPGMKKLNQSMDTTGKYLVRGEDSESIRSGSMRTHMWDRVYQEFQKSPIVGHGYMVTSERGSFIVWGDLEANWTTHDVWLHMLATTGIVGAGLLLWGLLRIVTWCASSFKGGARDPRTGGLLLLMLIWYNMWMLFDDTLIQAISLTSMDLYTLLGIAVGQLLPTPPRQMYDIASLQAQNGSPDPVNPGRAVPWPGSVVGYAGPGFQPPRS